MIQKNKVANSTILLVNKSLQEAEELVHQGKEKKALEVLESVNDFLLKEGSHVDVIRAKVLNTMADYYLHISNIQKAISFNQEALDIQVNLLGETAKETLSSRLIKGLIWHHLGKFKATIEYLLATLELCNAAKLTSFEEYAIMHWTIGNCYYQLRDAWQARLYYQKAAQIFEGLKTSNEPWRPLLNNSIGQSYAQIRDSKQALQYYQKALAEFIELVGEKHPHTSMVYTNIGMEYYGTSRYKEAVPYFQKSMDIWESLGDAYIDILADSYISFGTNYVFLEDFENAKRYLYKGLKISLQIYNKSHSKVIYAYHEIAQMYEHKGAYLQSLQVCQEGLVGAVALFKEENTFQNPSLQDMPIDNLCISLLNLKALVFIQIYLQKETEYKYLKAALGSIDLVIGAIERAYYYTDYSKLTSKRFLNRGYTNSIKIRHLVWEKTKGFEAIENAFSAIEKTKAYLLRMAMQGALSDANSIIPAGLLQEKQDLESKMMGLDKQLQMQKAEQEASGMEEKTTQNLQVRILENFQQYNRLIDQLKRDFPEYFQLKYQNQTASIAQIQQLLQPKELLLQYSLSKEHLFILTIGKNSVSFKKSASSKAFRLVIEDFRKAIILSDKKDYVRLALQLYHTLLTPVETELEGKTKLIIIPDGHLHGLPFGALLLPHQDLEDIGAFTELPYLIRDFDIQYQYSATLLWYAHQRKESAPYGEKKDFLGVAPVKFSKPAPSNNDLLLSHTEEEVEDLFSTEIEVQKIKELFENEKKETCSLLFEMATKEHLLKYIEQYQHILLSTHGFSDTRFSALSGLRLYALDGGVNHGLEEEHDKLYVAEIMELNLCAELVVLSSCESGIGNLQNGEGMMALHRAFLYAGAQNIVYTLFKVLQDSTSELIQTFYGHILEGTEYAAALRKAKLELIANPLMEPLDWAGFALIGK